MAGRIRDADVVAVRESTNIADVVSEQVTLRPAGGGSLKGLCPFHDERSPSFHVTPARGFYHCFGCGEGGDAIDFLRRTEGLSFAEAVERLADRAGIDLHYEEGGSSARAPQGQRTRLVAANAAAAELYQQALSSAEAEPGRSFLLERGFDAAAAARFGVGYAPAGWDVLVRHLTGKGYTPAEIVLAGLAREGRSGRPVDRFPGRLVWPIRDVGGDVVGFGARKLTEDDTGPKYLNTPETPIYHKSQVLYGLHEAKKEIARSEQAVVVEGYTDVMACHLAGVGTAVATCGTAFGEDHVKLLRRILYDTRFDRSAMVFVFDGDSAGQKAALRSFQEEQTFVTQTFVAVAPGGMDPCELRMAQGDEAVRALVDSRIGLFEFALRSALAEHDLSRPEGRVSALAAAAPVVAAIKDLSLRPEYTRRLAGMLGIEVEQAQAAVARSAPRRQAPGRPPQPPRREPPPAAGAAGAPGAAGADPAAAAPLSGSVARQVPHRLDPVYALERELLKAVLQMPAAVAEGLAAVPDDAVTAPAYAAVLSAVRLAGPPPGDDQAWVAAVLGACTDDELRSLVRELVVEPLRTPDDDPTAATRYARSLLARASEKALERRIGALRSQLQRMDPSAETEAGAAVFAELVALESRRHELRELT